MPLFISKIHAKKKNEESGTKACFALQVSISEDKKPAK